MAIRFDVRGDKTYLRFGEKMRVDAWYTGGAIFYLDIAGLGGELKVISLPLKYVDVFVDGSYCMDTFVKGTLDTYGFSQGYRRYALQLSLSYHDDNDSIYGGGGDELLSDTVRNDRNYLFFSKDGYHRARLGYQSWGATYIDGFAFLYRFEPDGTLVIKRKQLSLFYLIQDTDGRVYDESEYEELFNSVIVTLADWHWILEILGNYFGDGWTEGISVLSPTDNRYHCPILMVRDGTLLFKKNETDYLKECIVTNGKVHDGYESFSLDYLFNFIVSPTVSFTSWYKTLIRVLRGDYNPEHLSRLHSS